MKRGCEPAPRFPTGSCAWKTSTPALASATSSTTTSGTPGVGCVEEQSFATTTEHTITTEISSSGGGGTELDTAVCGFKIEMSMITSGGETNAYSKTLGQSKSLELEVDLGGVENRGRHRHQGPTPLPGEKVDRYRFMTFYLKAAPTTSATSLVTPSIPSG